MIAPTFHISSQAPGMAAILQEGEEENHPAWQLIAAGRYMPRRIRGSCRGRELG